MSEPKNKGTAVYLCHCGTNISDRIDMEAVKGEIQQLDQVAYTRTVEFACAETGLEEIQKDIVANRPSRCVFAACSPRDHEGTFRNLLRQSEMNPYLMQLTNIREHIAWVTEDRSKATQKAIAYVRAAIERVAEHVPLEEEKVDASGNALVIGAGPAGMKAALQLAEAGRKVTLVEQQAALGGMPVLYEEVFPNLECGPCLLEPLMAEVLHGPHAHNIELLTLTEVASVKGSYGNFIVELRQKARYVTDACIGCAECVPVCPVAEPDPVNFGRNTRNAMSFVFTAPLPNIPRLLDHLCLRFTQGEDCRLCEQACPMPGAVNLADQARTLERNVGAIVLAVGADLFDCTKIPTLGYGKVDNVVQALEFERWLSSNGPCEGKLVTKAGTAPRSVAIIHCVGSLDERHVEYCSGICCSYAFKFDHLIRKKAPGARITHLYKQLSIAGKDDYRLYNEARSHQDVEFLSYSDIEELVIKAGDDATISLRHPRHGEVVDSSFDIVVLCPAMIPKPSSSALGKMMDVGTGVAGFYRELHPRIDAAQSQVKGVYLAGTCQAPMDVQRAAAMAVASTGYVLSGLVEGRKLEIQPITASVREAACSGCRTCATVCPYKAIAFDEEKRKASVNRLLCMGCGTCVAGCPAGAITGNHFTNEAILAEIAGALA